MLVSTSISAQIAKQRLSQSREIVAYFAATALQLAHLYRRINHVVHSLIKIVSYIIILLGIVHISFAFPLHMNTDTLWFVGAGMAIIFAGLLNLVAINKGGSKFTKGIAVITNAANGAMFCFALPILNEPQVYVGIGIFLITTIAFLSDFLKHNSINQLDYEDEKKHTGPSS